MKVNQLLVVTFALLCFGSVKAQHSDSASYRICSLTKATVANKIDSIELNGTARFIELRKTYDSTINSTSIGIDRFYSRLDSVQKRGIATDHLISTLDSLVASKNKCLDALASKADSLKSALRRSLGNLNLPPELREKANELTSIIDKLDITKPNALQDYLNVSVPDIPQMDLPNVNLSTSFTDLKNPNLPSINTRRIGGQVQEYQNTFGKLPANVDDIAKIAEENVKNVSAVNDVQGELGKVSDITNISDKLQDQEALKKELIQEAQKQVADHFAGKQEQLNKAMQSISKYKSKFSTTASLNDLPKKAPNEMKGKPLIERIVPGLAFQLQKKNDDLLVDFNLYLGYRFTKRFTSGAGWNQRVGYNADKNAWISGDARIYGPRLFSEYKIGKGFSPRLELEVMNTFVPPYLNNTKSDPGSREWVPGAFVGIKKDYTLYKKIKGTAMVMFRPFDPHRKSPYADVVNARFGFEIPIKRKMPTMRSN